MGSGDETREKRPWYLLFAHARNHPLLNTCTRSGKSGRGTRILIHVIVTVTYKFSKYISIVACSEERNNHTTGRTTPPLFAILANLQSMTNGNTGRITPTYQAVSVFSKQTPKRLATCTFMRLIRSTYRRRELEAAGERRRTIETLLKLPCLISVFLRTSTHPPHHSQQLIFYRYHLIHVLKTSCVLRKKPTI